MPSLSASRARPTIRQRHWRAAAEGVVGVGGASSEELAGSRGRLLVEVDQDAGTDGDGHWRPELRPPSTFEECVAGYIWAALGSPEASVRWEAAHVVRHLCTFGKKEVLSGLVERLGDGSPGPFADTSLFFYSLHARQWLLIALGRAAHESPSTAAPHVSELLGIGLGEDPHVLMRRFAAECVTAVAGAKPGIVSEHDLERLHKVNQSPYEAVVSKQFERTTTSRCVADLASTDYVAARSQSYQGSSFRRHFRSSCAPSAWAA